MAEVDGPSRRVPDAEPVDHKVADDKPIHVRLGAVWVASRSRVAKRFENC